MQLEAELAKVFGLQKNICSLDSAENEELEFESASEDEICSEEEEWSSKVLKNNS
ncbi:MAG: hypothetical protein MHPSP_002996, partial [Paramarteilia canceri]